MEENVFILRKEGDAPKVAEDILQLAGNKKIFAVYGEMGAGKTTFIKALVKYLGVEENVSSPTFSIVNEYRSTPNQEKIFHADLYRLEDEQEAEEIGFEEYLTGENYIFIEWPQIIEHWLPSETISLHFEIIDKNSRKILFL